MGNSRIRMHGEYKGSFMDSVGDGTGLINMAVDGSVTPMYFKVTAGFRETLLINRLMIQIGDAGTLDAGQYGNRVILANGIELGVERDGEVILDLTKGLPVKTNADWAAYCYDVSAIAFGAGDNYIAVRWTFIKDGKALRLDEGDSFFIKIQDNLTPLNRHNCRLGMLSLKQ